MKDMLSLLLYTPEKSSICSGLSAIMTDAGPSADAAAGPRCEDGGLLSSPLSRQAMAVVDFHLPCMVQLPLLMCYRECC